MSPNSSQSMPSDGEECDATVASCPQQTSELRENVIVIGSELSYDSFWLKMMFVGAGYVPTRGGLRRADRNTLAYVDAGYTHLEKLTFEQLRDQAGFNIVRIGAIADLTNHLNNRTLKQNGRDHKVLLQDVKFFCHGVPGALKLNYAGKSIDFNASALRATDRNIFVPDGRIYSYACRTGISSTAFSFSKEKDAGLERSLAQQMADHYGIETHAYLRRTHYGRVLRDPNDSDTLSSTLKAGRAGNEGQVIPLPPEHEALPHPGLRDKFYQVGAWREGTNAYALWRKAGGISLPEAGDTPEGLSATMRVFTASSAR